MRIVLVAFLPTTLTSARAVDFLLTFLPTTSAQRKSTVDFVLTFFPHYMCPLRSARVPRPHEVTGLAASFGHF